jgi:hypothetical protein
MSESTDAQVRCKECVHVSNIVVRWMQCALSELVPLSMHLSIIGLTKRSPWEILLNARSPDTLLITVGSQSPRVETRLSLRVSPIELLSGVHVYV